MCLRLLICLPALASVLLGIAVIIFPTWISMGSQFDFNSLNVQSTYMAWPLYVYWIVGVVFIVFGFTLCSCATHLDSMASRVTGLIVALLLIAFVVVVVVHRSYMHGKINDSVRQLQYDYRINDSPKARSVMDSMQQYLHCCGSDFLNTDSSSIIDYPDGGTNGWKSWLQYECLPPSCARNLQSGIPQAFQATCAAGLGPVNLNKLMTVGAAAASAVNYALGGGSDGFEDAVYTTSCTYRLSWALWIVLGFISLVGLMMLLSFVCANVCCRRRYQETHENVKYGVVSHRGYA